MDKKLLALSRVVCSLGILVAVVTGAAVLSSSPAGARPAPDCGPTFTWDCTMPDGSHQSVEGTRCEIAAFQKQTGARCVIS